jgi:hypothetical protein
MAGQIALDPPTMTLLGGGAAAEAARSLASAEACARVLRSSERGNSLWCTMYTSVDGGVDALQAAEQAWRAHLDGTAARFAGPFDVITTTQGEQEAVRCPPLPRPPPPQVSPL